MLSRRRRRAHALALYLAVRARRAGLGPAELALLELHLVTLYTLLPWPERWVSLALAWLVRVLRPTAGPPGGGGAGGAGARWRARRRARGAVPPGGAGEAEGQGPPGVR